MSITKMQFITNEMKPLNLTGKEAMKKRDILELLSVDAVGFKLFFDVIDVIDFHEFKNKKGFLNHVYNTIRSLLPNAEIVHSQYKLKKCEENFMFRFLITNSKTSHFNNKEFGTYLTSLGIDNIVTNNYYPIDNYFQLPWGTNIQYISCKARDPSEDYIIQSNNRKTVYDFTESISSISEAYEKAIEQYNIFLSNYDDTINFNYSGNEDITSLRRQNITQIKDEESDDSLFDSPSTQLFKDLKNYPKMLKIKKKQVSVKNNHIKYATYLTNQYNTTQIELNGKPIDKKTIVNIEQCIIQNKKMSTYNCYKNHFISQQINYKNNFTNQNEIELYIKNSCTFNRKGYMITEQDIINLNNKFSNWQKLLKYKRRFTIKLDKTKLANKRFTNITKQSLLDYLTNNITLNKNNKYVLSPDNITNIISEFKLKGIKCLQMFIKKYCINLKINKQKQNYLISKLEVNREDENYLMIVTPNIDNSIIEQLNMFDNNDEESNYDDDEDMREFMEMMDSPVDEEDLAQMYNNAYISDQINGTEKDFIKKMSSDGESYEKSDDESDDESMYSDNELDI